MTTSLYVKRHLINALRGKSFSDEHKKSLAKKSKGASNSRALKWTVESEQGSIFIHQ